MSVILGSNTIFIRDLKHNHSVFPLFTSTSQFFFFKIDKIAEGLKMIPHDELYKEIIQNQPVVLLERIHVEQRKSYSTSDGIKNPKRAIETSARETNQDENEQPSKRKNCSHCVEIEVLKQHNDQQLRQTNELQEQLNYLSTIVEEVVEQQFRLANTNVETSQQIAEFSNTLRMQTQQTNTMSNDYMDVDQQITEMVNDISLEEQRGSGCNIL